MVVISEADVLAIGSPRAGASFSVTDFGAKGDGVRDDTAALTRALTAAGTTGVVTSPPGKTFLVSSRITLNAGARMDFNGSTIKKGPTMTTEAILVSGAGAVIRNLLVEGNKAAGATGDGITVTGSATIENTTVQNVTGGCVYANGGTATCRNVTCTSGFDGFIAAGAGVLKIDTRCTGSSCGRAGVFIASTATGHEVNGRFTRNVIAGVWVYTGDNGRIDYVSAEDNDNYNVIFSKQAFAGISISDWQIGILHTKDQGKTGNVLSGANVYFAGCSRFEIGTVISRGGNGWGLALVSADGSGGTGVGTADCSLGVVVCDNTGAADTDAGITFQTGAKRNMIGYASVRGHSWAVTISEEYAPVGNDYNTIGELHATGCPWGILSFRGGNYNHFGRVVGRDCGTADATLAKALIDFKPHPVTGGGVNRGNTVGFFDYKDSRTSTTRPMALFHAETTESGNSVLDGVARDADANVNDENGGNSVSLRPALRLASIDTFEAGWAGGADNVTAGRFVEGTKGRRVVSSTGGGNADVKTGMALNLSAMGDDEWFRMFIYVENVADKHAVSPLLVRMGADASNYFQWTITPEALRVNGAQYIRMRKGAFVSLVGAPNWNNINYIALFPISAAASTFALTFDNLERVYPDRFSRHIGGVLPHGLPVASGEGVVSTGKWNVNDAGTWKSAVVA